MKKSRKVLSLLLAVILVFPSIVCVATVSASAAELDSRNRYQEDYFGEIIYDYMEEYLTMWCSNYFTDRIQNPHILTTFVFVDDQLLSYGFVEYICNAINYSGIFAELGDITWDNLYEYTGIKFLVHHNDYTFYDLQTRINNLDDEVYDFSDFFTYESVPSLANFPNMCAIGVWYPGSDLFAFLNDMQEFWNDNFPIYYIYIDPIEISEDGLIFMVYDSLEKVFYYCDQAPGVIYQ